MSEKIQYDQYDPVMLYQLRQFFRMTEDTTAQELIYKYQDSRGMNKTHLWAAVSQQLNISSQIAYKYFTNTWSRRNLKKWPKELKVQLKQLLNKKINNEFQPGSDMDSYRKKTLDQFLLDMKIKETQEYKQYYFESLYYYLNNNITSQLLKLNKSVTQVKTQEVKNSFFTVQCNCQSTIGRFNINLPIPAMTYTGIENIDQSQLIDSNQYKTNEIKLTQNEVQLYDQTSDSLTDEFNYNLSAQETSYIVFTGMAETQRQSLQINKQDEINLYSFDLKSTDSSADQDFTGCYNSMKEQVQEQLEIVSIIYYVDESFVFDT